MNASFRQQGSAMQRTNGFLSGLRVFGGILNRMAGFIQMTEEEQREAGIYLGNNT